MKPTVITLTVRQLEEGATTVLTQGQIDLVLTRYWIDNYADRHCTLCGNSGVIDSLGVKTAAGFLVGRLNYCICSNGRVMREQGVRLVPKE